MFKDAPYSEENILALIVQGDEVAFTKFFTLHRNRIYSIAFKITHSTTAAEEIVQDVFLKIWLRKDRLIEIQNFSAYLFVVTRNTVYKALNRIAKNYEISVLTDKDQLVADSDSADLLMEKEYNF